MKDLLMDFRTYFVNASLTTEKDCSIDTMPSSSNSPKTHIAIYEYMGMQGPAQIEGAHRSIQIVVRDKNSNTARSKAKELHRSLMTEDHIIQLTDERWGMLYLRQPPFRFKVDENQQVYYAFNLGITTYLD